MINDPTITATCDKCHMDTEPMEMCSLAGGGWDQRHIKRQLERSGWKVKGDTTLCEECAEEDADD